jgi:hypothetical protein
LGAILTPGSGIRDGRKSASGSGIQDEQPGSYFLELRTHFFAFFRVKILKFFDEDPGSGMETVQIRDPGWKKVGSGMEKSRIRDQGLTSRIRHTVVTDATLTLKFSTQILSKL